MINLIPQQAKKSIVTEYWVRVFSVWLLLWSFALVCGAAIIFPAFILVGSQVEIYQESASLASQKVADQETVSQELIEANKQAKEILEQAKLTSMSSYIDLFTQLQGSDIEIRGLSLSRQEGEIAPVRITGVAAGRQQLASFRDRMLELPQIAEVDLPISNLANEKDIQFSITVTMNKSTAI